MSTMGFQLHQRDVGIYERREPHFGSLAPENEHLLMKAIGELTRGKTLVTIAHRLNTVRGADQILVVDAGRIVQRGTHDKLMQEEGIYRRFIRMREEAAGWRLGHKSTN